MKLLYSSTLPPLLFVPLVPLPLLYPLRSVASLSPLVPLPGGQC